MSENRGAYHARDHQNADGNSVQQIGAILDELVDRHDWHDLQAPARAGTRRLNGVPRTGRDHG